MLLNALCIDNAYIEALTLILDLLQTNCQVHLKLHLRIEELLHKPACQEGMKIEGYESEDTKGDFVQ